MQVDELSLQHRHRLAEHAALAECQCLIQEASSGWQVTAKAAGQSSHAASQQAAQEFMHAATRHLYYQRALLQLLLRQLTFCVTELKGMTCRQSPSTNMPCLSSECTQAVLQHTSWDGHRQQPDCSTTASHALLHASTLMAIEKKSVAQLVQHLQLPYDPCLPATKQQRAAQQLHGASQAC